MICPIFSEPETLLDRCVFSQNQHTFIPAQLRIRRDVHIELSVFFQRNGADEVVYPEKQLAKWAAIRYSSEHILDYIELQDDHAIMEVTIPPEWMDRTIGEINIRKKYYINNKATSI